jgi:hypothetical protein
MLTATDLHDAFMELGTRSWSLDQIANAFTKNWIPAFAGMTLLVFWSVMPA